MTTETKPDKYDIAIAGLREIYETKGEERFKDIVSEHWNEPFDDEPGCLFQYCTSNGHLNRGSMLCGCLTQIKGSHHVVSENESLTKKIRDDDRIPLTWRDINHPDQLLVFGEYQREMDAMWPGRGE